MHYNTKQIHHPPSTSYSKRSAGIAIIILLIVSLNNYEWTILESTFTPERILAAPLFIISLLLVIAERRKIKTSRTSLILLAWLAIALFSSLASKVSGWSAKMYIVQITAASFYFLILWLNPDPVRIFNSKPFFLIAWFMGPTLSVVYLVYISGIPTPDFVAHWFQEGSGGTRIRATITEANLFGVFVSLLTLIVLSKKKIGKLWWWTLLLGLHGSLILSFSRIPWAAYIASLFIYYSILNPRSYTLRRAMNLSLTSLLTLSAAISIGLIIFSEFGDNEIIGRTHSANARFIMWGLAANSIIEHPLLGNGIYSFSELYSFAPELVGSDTSRSAWISNIFIAILHDTGIVGLILFFHFLFTIIRIGVQRVRALATSKTADPYRTRIGAALTAFAISLIISGQSIPAHSLAFFWIAFALLEVYAKSTSKNSNASQAQATRIRANNESRALHTSTSFN
ncbi:hypothetical protein D9M68_268250 [compost metagenome]